MNPWIHQTKGLTCQCAAVPNNCACPCRKIISGEAIIMSSRYPSSLAFKPAVNFRSLKASVESKWYNVYNMIYLIHLHSQGCSLNSNMNCLSVNVKRDQRGNVSKCCHDLGPFRPCSTPFGSRAAIFSLAPTKGWWFFGSWSKIVGLPRNFRMMILGELVYLIGFTT